MKNIYGKEVVYVAEVQPLDSKETEFIESIGYDSKKEFELALDQAGYIVKKVVPQDSYRMW